MTEIQHELIMPNKDLPFKMFLFEGRDGNYIREKHWHRSIEIFAVFQGTLEFYLNDQEYLLECGDFIIVNSNEVHSIHAPKENMCSRCRLICLKNTTPGISSSVSPMLRRHRMSN